MRLIDADKLKVDYIVPSTSTNTSCYQYVSKEQIDNAPTIDQEWRGGWTGVSPKVYTGGMFCVRFPNPDERIRNTLLSVLRSEDMNEVSDGGI